MGRRTILLIAALSVAALGTVLVWMYAAKAKDAALAGQELVQVLVATHTIEVGTTGAEISANGYAELRKVPLDYVPSGAISDLTPVVDQAAVSTIFAGQVLLSGMFGAQQQTGVGLPLPEGTMAVSVSLGDPQRVAGFVRPGSEVAIFVTAEGIAGKPQTQTALLLPRVPVVAVGPSTASPTASAADGTSNTESIPTAILTLALTQKQAQQVVQAQTSGSLYLALLNDKSATNGTAGGTTTDNLRD